MFHHSAVESLRHLLAGRKATRFNVGIFKVWTGISRKYAIPLAQVSWIGSELRGVRAMKGLSCDA